MVTLELPVEATAGDFQVHAALMDVDAAGVERMICGATDAVRGGSAGTHTLRFEFDDTAYRFAAGHRVRLVLENVALNRTPGQLGFREVPAFVDVDVRVVLDPNAPATLTLPVAAVAGADLTPRVAEESGASGFTLALDLTTTHDRAGQPFLFSIDFDAESVAPGLPPAWIPGSSIGWAERLDAGGSFSLSGVVPPLLSRLWIGQRLVFRATGFDGAELWTSGPSVLTITP